MACNNTCLMGDICGDRYRGGQKPPCASKPVELSTTAPNTGSPKLRENTMELLEAVSAIVGGTSVPSREELDCAAEQLDICIAQLRAGA